MALKIGVKFEGKLTCAFKNDMRNLANFQQSMFNSLEIGTFIGWFYPKQKMYKFKIYGGRYVMTMKNDARFEEELMCQFKIDMRNLTNFDPSTQKTQQITLLK